MTKEEEKKKRLSEKYKRYRQKHRDEINARRREKRRKIREEKERILKQKSEEIIKKSINTVSPLIYLDDKEYRFNQYLLKKGIRKEGIQWRKKHLKWIKNLVTEMKEWLDTPHKNLSYDQHEISEANKYLVECPICGKLDNDWKPRGGLCIDCWCREFEHFTNK